MVEVHWFKVQADIFEDEKIKNYLIVGMGTHIVEYGFNY